MTSESERLTPDERNALESVLAVVRAAAQSEMDDYMSNHVDAFIAALAAVDPPLTVVGRYRRLDRPEAWLTRRTGEPT